eukprot:2118834-Ditylum_brightwellii.AAC.1
MSLVNLYESCMLVPTAMYYQFTFLVAFQGCQKKFSLQHALDFKVGGLVMTWYNEVQNELTRVSTQSYSKSLRQAEAIVDVRMINLDAKSYLSRLVEKHLEALEKEKKDKYLKVCIKQRENITLLFVQWTEYWNE